jgi:glycosyltransferase involved in cell wall biosynthesis
MQEEMQELTTEAPEVSVVMSVYNGALHLRETVNSILSQEGVGLELVVVNDGSTDESPAILEEYANRDSRVRILHQENQGLTSALIRGCAAAKGEYIARQDAGDISLPGRLIKQMNYLTEAPNAAFVSSGTRYVGPGGEHLYEVKREPSEADERLMTLDLDRIQGPSSHPSTLFSRDLYELVGGYRSAFYFAQDLDLWIRLGEVGKHIVMREVLYQAAFALGSISGLYRKEQIETARIILECAKLRREGKSEEPGLEKARSIKPQPARPWSRLGRAKALYFIGMCLKKSGHPSARSYFKQALQTNPLHLKSAARLVFRGSG